MTNLTPMLRQYYQLKEEHPGCILLFRLGDFYEMFGEDAKLASRLLQITLTSREVGKGQRIPMCGVPYHSVEGYVAELVRSGHKVAICEQVEDPRTAKGVVRREVIRVVTPGTILEAEMLEAKENNYLAAVCRHPQKSRSPGRLIELPQTAFGLAVCDLSTGEFSCTEMSGEDALSLLKDELGRISPAEILLDPSFFEPAAREELEVVMGAGARLAESYPGAGVSLETARRRLLEHFKTESLEGFGCEHLPAAVRAAAAVIEYLTQTQKSRLAQIARLTTYSVGGLMLLDPSTRRNLELTRTLRTNERRGTLLWVLDKTLTAMGGRLLRRWIEAPLVEAAAINTRLGAVKELVEDPALRRAIREGLERVHDIERLTGRIAHGSANARDLVALKESLLALPSLKEALLGAAASTRLRELAEELDPCREIAADIGRTLVDDPPVSVTEGGLIRPGFSKEVDELTRAKREGKAWIAELEKRERERTQIKSLKVGFNKVFGYYVEVTKPNLHLVPADYERRQTLAHAERFVTPELKEKEALILGAEERVIELEYQLFTELRARVGSHTPRLQQLARNLAELDVYASLAEVAVERGYVCPVVDEEDRIEIREGRHPVVEATLPGSSFVPNDLVLDSETRIVILTGPNMAGKSTYLRQAALIVLMAQIGSFVPAAEARIGVVDRIFTRVGASDDLATGQSTFMVEMNEVANILNHATEKSLVILDEVGRGTSTFDGLSIAWAVTEYLHNHERVRPKTLFATHYHELTELESLLPRVKNYSVAVREEGGEILFLRRIVRGGADQSYGIEVARLAGLPGPLIERARQILAELESGEAERRRALEAPAATGAANGRSRGAVQLPLFTEPDPVIAALEQVDIDRLTPLDALNLLARLAAEVRRRRERR